MPLADCTCCNRTKVRVPKGGLGGLSLPGTSAVWVCPDCDLQGAPARPWPQGKPPGV